MIMTIFCALGVLTIAALLSCVILGVEFMVEIVISAMDFIAATVGGFIWPLTLAIIVLIFIKIFYDDYKKSTKT